MNAEDERLIRRIFYLAWKASRVVGMGVLEDKGDAPTEDHVWEGIIGRRDYPAAPSQNPSGTFFDADYVFGRMVKLGVNVKDGEIKVGSENARPRDDYQSWCPTYPTYDLLKEAAINSLSEEATA